MRSHRLFLEPTVSAVRDDHISNALVTNKTCSSVNLNDDVLGTFEVFDLSSIEEPLPLPVAGTENADVTDLTDVMAHLRPHVNVLYYTEAKPALLHL